MAATTAAVLLVAGGATAFAMDKRVTLDVDGEPQTVHTFGDTVADVLEAAEVDLDEHDAVAPDLDSDVERGGDVVVRSGRPVELTLDGDTDTHWVTASTVGQALRQLGYGTEPLDLSTDRATEIPEDGMEIEARSARRVVLLQDTARLEDETVAETVADFLDAHGVETGEHDIVTPEPDTELEDDMVVNVLELLSEPETEEVVIEAETEEVETDELERGEEEIVQEPEDGLKEVTTALVRMEGEETEHVLEEEILEEPTDGIVEVGTAEPEDDSDSDDGAGASGQSGGDANVGGDVDNLNWAALAECESGGDPTVVNPAGPYYGLYQFDEPTWQSVGGTGLPSEASPSEQTMRAKMLYEQAGGSSPWPHCGSYL
ncbi:ubiquitin-like domain-containing protein [Lipingzhangella rawalii]|uniref:ubiquitin-like domain-containing protein n=1 Tax=Lipingzhangella rawalii TaxID=2055835 RepID=UPI00287B8DD2|nr:ubiquitin-like domain-containing protein [Lipingzhangella rawalii]